ncbi:hypothetical protein [Priestia megaterium]|uniref:hypothetical protein n=1 Tax=Priestia megaterium TaxID=1404 RepID=UPI0020A0126C|nr:hypothetical protein [Priestia megaterium]MCP1452375.1 hypothetical protein [Priestia megaterium]
MVEKSNDILINTGLLKIKQGETKFVSNASVIEGVNGPLVCTAAHCVFDWYKQLCANEITFMSLDGKKYEINNVYISSEWVKNGVVDYDTAFMTLKDPSLKNEIAIQPIFNNSEIQKAFIPYIKKNIFGKSRLKIQSETTFKDYLYGSSLIGVKGNLAVGSSGSPWIIKNENKFYQISNTSLSFNSAKNIIWGPYWGQHIKELYLQANTEKSEFKNISIYKI